MDYYDEMLKDLETFDGPEVFRQMQEKQKEEVSKMLGEEQTMPAAQEEKKAGRGRKRKEETFGQVQKQIHISIPLSHILMLQSLYSVPGLPIRKILREAIMNCIQEQFKKNGKQLKNMFNKDMLNSLDL